MTLAVTSHDTIDDLMLNTFANFWKIWDTGKLYGCKFDRCRWTEVFGLVAACVQESERRNVDVSERLLADQSRFAGKMSISPQGSKSRWVSCHVEGPKSANLELGNKFKMNQDSLKPFQTKSAGRHAWLPRLLLYMGGGCAGSSIREQQQMHWIVKYPVCTRRDFGHHWNLVADFFADRGRVRTSLLCDIVHEIHRRSCEGMKGREHLPAPLR